jgi:hypothetical protein
VSRSNRPIFPELFADVPKQRADVPGYLADVPEQFAVVPGQCADVQEQRTDVPGRWECPPFDGTGSSTAADGRPSAMTGWRSQDTGAGIKLCGRGHRI